MRDRPERSGGGGEGFVVPRKPEVTLVEGRGLSSRQMQDVAKDTEIGQPINSGNEVQKLPMASHAKEDGVRSCPRAGCGKSARPVR